MSDRCEPPEGLRGVHGWHWCKDHMARELLCFWVFAPSGARWDGGISPDKAFAAGWRYLAPVATPAEVNALRAELAAVREALDTFVETMDMWAGDNSDRAHDGIWRAIKTARAALGDPA